MMRLRVDDDGIYLGGHRLDDVTQLVIHMSDGRTFAHLTLPVEAYLDIDIEDVRTIHDNYAMER